MRVRPTNGGRGGRTAAVVLAVLAVTLAGCTSPRAVASTGWVEPGPSGGIGVTQAPAPALSPSPTPSPSHSPSPSPSRSPKPIHKPSPSHTPTSTKPADSPCVKPHHGTFTVASGGSPIAGRGGTLYHYEVQVQTGIGVSAAAFAAAIDATLAGKLGWTDSGTRRFQRVSGSSCDFVVELATASTSQQICAGYGVNTQGLVSCRGGREVVINLDRWTKGDPGDEWTGHLDVYRDLVVNHEVGHFLGYSHMKCGGTGKPLPVMATPYFDGLEGCVINGWPYDSSGKFISGPPQT